jgi:hypothetical protein
MFYIEFPTLELARAAAEDIHQRTGVIVNISNTPPPPALHIEGRRWFQRSYGNTYHSVRIYMYGQLVAHLPHSYGYGDHYLQTALDWLKANGHAPADAEYGTRYLREELHGTYSVADVPREKDL